MYFYDFSKHSSPPRVNVRLFTLSLYTVWWQCLSTNIHLFTHITLLLYAATGDNGNGYVNSYETLTILCWIRWREIQSHMEFTVISGYNDDTGHWKPCSWMMRIHVFYTGWESSPPLLANASKNFAGWVKNKSGWVEFCIGSIRDYPVWASAKSFLIPSLLYNYYHGWWWCYNIRGASTSGAMLVIWLSLTFLASVAQGLTT